MADPQPSMPDQEGLLQALSDMEIVTRAMADYASVDSYQTTLLSRFRKLHHYYAPIDGDQWPEDIQQRPGKLHVTVNKLKPAVDVDARLQALVPRVVCHPNGIDPQARLDASNAEKIMQRFLELSAWDIWLSDFTKIKCLYGFGVLKVFWNTKEKRPDVRAVENPGNLRIGWGASDFSVIDWTIYESKLSGIQIMRQYPNIVIRPGANADAEPITELRSATEKSDPLNQVTLPVTRPNLLDRPLPYQPSDYEKKQIPVWDYWFKDTDGVVWNAVIVGRRTLAKIAKHTELPDIPYIVVENDHEPGVPWGIATHEHLIDIQIEYNRAYSHALQLVADEIDPSWQMTGENADSVPDGLVPRGGEIIAAGAGNEIKPIPKSLNFPPIQAILSQLNEDYHDVSGLPRILFGQSPGSQTTGKALAVQVEAAANRLDFKRRRLYRGLVELLQFWAFMLEKQKPRVNGQNLGLAVAGFRRWEIVAPEITPKDVIEATTNAINQVQAKIISLKTARDVLGYDSPEDEEQLVVEERSNVDLFPGDVQVKTAVLQALASLQQQQQAAAAQGQPTDPNAAGADAQGNLANQSQQAQPSLGQSNNDGSVQPATLQGSPAPAGGPPPGGGTTATTLIRPNLQTGQATALEQLAQTRRF